MKYENIEATMKVQNKLNGKWYEVTGTTKNNAALTEVLTEDQISEGVKPDGLMLTPENAICFRLDPDSIPHHVPEGYDVVDGILMHGGAPVTEQGEIVLDDHIYGYMKDVVILSKTISPDKEEHQLVLYNTFKDTFKVLSGDVFTECEEIDLQDGVKALVITRRETVPVKDEDDNDILNEDGSPKTKEVVTGHKLLVLTPESTRPTCEQSLMSLSNVKVFMKEIHGTKELFVTGVDDMINDGIGFVKADNPKKDICFLTMDLESGWGSDEIYLPGEVTSVTRDVDNSLVIKGEDYFYFENLGHGSRIIQNKSVAALAGFDYLVSADIRNSKETYVFANDQMDVRTLVRTKTSDRGDIVTIE